MYLIFGLTPHDGWEPPRTEAMYQWIVYLSIILQYLFLTVFYSYITDMHNELCRIAYNCDAYGFRSAFWIEILNESLV